jgi:arginase
LAVKIVRQPKKIALIGAPSSAAAFLAGSEKAPAALRAAGLVEKLQNAGFEVIDQGDCAPRLFADDEEHRRARNLPAIVAGLADLKLRAEGAVKSGALVLVLGGDCAQVIGLLTGARRYYKNLNLVWLDRDADLNTPATTPSGRIDGMVVANIIGKGAPEMVRFWGDGAIVREPDVLLLGLQRVDPGEQEFLAGSPMRRMYLQDMQFKGAQKSAQEALRQVHADTREFVLHIDTDVLDAAELSSVNVPGDGGLRFDEARTILQAIVRHKNLLGLDVAQYNPDKDADGSGAKKLVDLLVEVLSARLSEEEPALAEAPTNAVAPVAESPVAEFAAKTEQHEAHLEVASPEAIPSKTIPESDSAETNSTSARAESSEADTPEISSAQSSS